MRQYLDLLDRIRERGEFKGDRTGTGTQGVFGHEMRFDLADGFPLVTTKKMFTKGVIHELLWFVAGETNIRPLVEKGVRIWTPDAHKAYVVKTGEPVSPAEFEERVLSDDAFAEKWGDLGPVYGRQWRAWRRPDGTTFDQLAWVCDELKRNPNSRRLIVQAWNPGETQEMALPPCHMSFQLNVGGDGRLNLNMIQRSADSFLGVPFNIASYALLQMMIARSTGFEPGEFVHWLGDAHVYRNHLDQVDLQRSREPRPLPTMRVPVRDSVFDYRYDDFKLEGYDPHPAIKGEISV